ncbi:host attachment protein [Piscinibacter gummiphilus]|uniref:Host attachment protein n=1 Tax=Piscinibacter gummiphilus TaxID=946333 RepID=A0ABZ0D078_9BURK|nr:host attachment protein [Piscinibacter gummiphilus]WOB10623.1 host attachment protein [Piscinibacter gummiphilus]
MKAELTLVANASEAHLFARESRHDPLMPLALMKHTESRARASELEPDRAGHGSSDRHPGGVAFAPRMSRKRKEHLQFADEVARRIDAELGSGRYGSVVLFASCPFLGELRSQLSPAAKRSLKASVDLDLTSFGVDELERRVADALHRHESAH